MNDAIPVSLLRRYSKMHRIPDTGDGDEVVIAAARREFGDGAVVWNIRRYRRWDLRHFGQRWLEVSVILPESVPQLRAEWERLSGQAKPQAPHEPPMSGMDEFMPFARHLTAKPGPASGIDSVPAAQAAREVAAAGLHIPAAGAALPDHARVAAAAAERAAPISRAVLNDAWDRWDRRTGRARAGAASGSKGGAAHLAVPENWQDLAEEARGQEEWVRSAADRARALAGEMAEILAQEMRERLLSQGIAPVYAYDLIRRASASLSAQERWQRRRWEEAIQVQLEADIPLRGAYRFGTAVRRLALVGPTGVGKTTTLAKLAGQLYRQGTSFALITTDTYRVGAVSQLEEYAKILGVPLEVCFSADELRAAVRRRRDVDVLLLDTTGRAPGHPAVREELTGLLDAFVADEVALVVSATTKDEDLDRVAGAFGELPLTSLIVTKVDETESLASIYNLVRKHRIALAYLGTGQSVPDDLQVASGDALLAGVLGTRERTHGSGF